MKSLIVLLALVVTVSAGHVATDIICDEILDVAIIGAGPAGAYSAYKLRDRNLSIGVFEHSDRIGGRLFTAKLPNVPDHNLELGAMRFIDGHHTLVQNLVEELNLDSRVFLSWVNSTYGDRVFRRNVSMTKEEFQYGDVPYNLTAEEKQHQPHLLNYLLTKLINYPLANLTEDEIFNLTTTDGRKVYTLSVPEALRTVGSEEAVRYLLDEDHYDSERISVADLLYEQTVDIDHTTGESIRTMYDGMSSIPRTALKRFLAASEKHSLHKNCRLRSIHKLLKDIYLMPFEQTRTVNGITFDVPTGIARKMVCARKIILAVPKFALKRIHWEPLQSDEYRRLLNGTSIIHASKVFMTFDRPWWLENSRYPAENVNAEGLGEVYTWGESNKTGDHTMLVSYTKLIDTDEQYAYNQGIKVYYPKSLDSIPEGDDIPPLLRFGKNLPPINGSVPGENKVTEPLKNYLLDTLCEVFGVPRDEIPEPKTAIARFWIKYPFGGGWVLTKPGYTYDELLEGIPRPSKRDNVFVVGSDFATKDLTGWTEGALTTVETLMSSHFL